MIYDYEYGFTLKDARARCAELLREGKVCGIYKGHRGYVVKITYPFIEEKRQ